MKAKDNTKNHKSISRAGTLHYFIILLLYLQPALLLFS